MACMAVHSIDTSLIVKPRPRYEPKRLATPTSDSSLSKRETVNSEGDRVDLDGHAVQTWIAWSRAALGLVSISCTDLRTTV